MGIDLSNNNIIWYERCVPKEEGFEGVLFGLEKLHPMGQFSAIYEIKRGGGEVSVATSSPYVAETVIRLFDNVKVFKYSGGRLETSSAEEMFRSFCKPFEVFECLDGAALKGEDEVEVLESGYLEWQSA